MAKTTAPLMSLGASGSIGGAITFSTWKGRPYVRQLVTPANPQSATQTWVRAMFAFLGTQWAAIGGTAQSTWSALADMTKISGFNAFVANGQKRWTTGQYPQQEYQMATTTYTATLSTATSTGGVRQATLSLESTDSAGTTWYAVIHRSTTTGFTPAASNVIAVVPCNHTTPTAFIDTPLAPNTYYYVCQPFSIDGQAGTVHAQTSATVTGD